MLMMKNLGAIFASRIARGALGALTVAAAAWLTASSAEAAVEKKRILKAGELLEPRWKDAQCGTEAATRLPTTGNDEGESGNRAPSTFI